MAVGFFVAKNFRDVFEGATPGGGFHDQEIQDLLLPFFVAGGQGVDPYDGGAFEGDLLRELQGNLEKTASTFSKQNPNLGFSETRLERYFARGRVYGLSLQPPKEQLLADLESVLELIQIALERNETLFFQGD